MSHEIFGERFQSRVQPAWHQLGLVFSADEDLLPSEAVARVAGDIKFQTSPVFFEFEGAKHTTDNYAVIRLPTHDDPHPRSMGIATERWNCDSYVVLSKALDRIDRTVFKVETCGLMHRGDILFLALRGEDWSLLGKDEIRSYFTINLSQRVGVGHRAMQTTVRVVCQNTNNAAIASSKIDLRISHSADAAQQIGLTTDLLVRFRAAQEETKRIFEAFATTPATAADVDAIALAAFPAPSEPNMLRLLRNVVGVEGAEVFRQSLDVKALASLSETQERHEKASAKAEDLRVAAVERFEAFQPSELRGTVWAAYNGATEVSDWRGDSKQTAESVLIGSRAAEKARAFSAAFELVGGEAK